VLSEDTGQDLTKVLLIHDAKALRPFAYLGGLGGLAVKIDLMPLPGRRVSRLSATV
jgi:hypothetical protein